MKLKDMRFKITNENGCSFVIGWDDIFGSDKEKPGVYSYVQHGQYTENIIQLSRNSVYGFGGLNDKLDIEVIE